MSDPIPMLANRRSPVSETLLGRVTAWRTTGCVALTVLAEPIQIERFDDSSPRTKAKVDRRLNYMRVAVRYDARNVNMEIVDSRGLKQSEDKIHKRAFVWLRQLEQRVRRALGTPASRV